MGQWLTGTLAGPRGHWYAAAVVAAWSTVVLVAHLSDEGFSDPDMAPIRQSLRADHSLRAVGSWFVGDWVQHGGYYRPITSISLWADFLIWDDWPRGYRLGNVVLLVATMASMVYLADVGLGLPWAGVLGAAVLCRFSPVGYFINHPAARTDALAGLFLLVATALALRHARDGGRGRLMWALALFLCAIWSKEVAFIWPVFALGACLLMGERRRALKLFAAAAAMAAVLWLARTGFLGQPLTGPTIDNVCFTFRRELRVFAEVLLDPLVTHVTMTYRVIPETPDFWMALPLWRALFLDLWFIVMNVLLARRRPRVLAVLWLWRAVIYLPSWPFALIFPHYGYLPDLGTALLHGAGMAVAGPMLWARFRRPDTQTGTGPDADRHPTEVGGHTH